MDYTSGIGGLNVEKDESVDSNFDLFGKTEYEVGVKKLVSQIFRPLSSPNTTGPFTFKIPSNYLYFNYTTIKILLLLL